MANPFAETILEGFICPKCMLTFGTPDLLSHHFILEHQNSGIAESEENVSITQSVLRPQFELQNSFAFYDRKDDNQPVGTCHSLTSKFLELRKCHVNRSSAETNSLLIRLEKLIEVADAHESDRKAFEQTIVPWINAKVDLCPSCGKAFGLGTEMAYPDEDDDCLDSSQNTSNSISKYWLSKTNVTRLTNAILDYNPIYRRRHHCRLCGSILCADCSYFISVNKARSLLNALNGQDLDIFPGSVNTTDTGNESDRCLESENMFRPGNIRFAAGDYELRVCSVCKAVLEKKINSLRNTSVTTPIIQMHIEFKELMQKVCEWLPSYSIIAESLNSGEQKYALESARSMHSDLLQALQKIELLGRQFSKFSEPDSEFYVNRALARLALSVSRRAKHFVQNYLPPLRTLPTLKQYDSLTSQRKDELSARWLEEDRALAELMERVNPSKPNGTDISSGINTTTTKLWKRLFQQPNSPSNPKGAVSLQKKKTTIQSLSDIAKEIDQVAAQLMIARKEGRLGTADELARKLDQLEQEFQYVSNNLDDDSELFTTT
ncbi:unnamed protein product [Trichobilharzia szidati]|nr:unnamed protein product [Trichobilharzia szidati]